MGIAPSASTVALLALAVLIAGCSRASRETDGRAPTEARTPASTPAPPTAEYVGSARCERCHAEEHARWSGSHHDLAMAVPSPEVVRGDFDDARVTVSGVTTRLRRRPEGLVVETDGPDGRPAEFPVRYTFGVHPLQQYLVELREGRLQALPIAWDSREAAAGGQRWFHVYGADRVDHRDVLHWTRIGQSWESMCAECHSTALVTAYDRARDRFTTTWAEIDVACEACHGPASAHLAWAETEREDPTRGFAVSFDERRSVTWAPAPETGKPRRSRPRVTTKEIDACAPCHARRTRLTNDARPGDAFLDHHRPSWVAPPAYHADGQIAEEDYEWGPFLQSRMYQAGVTCSDCHDPHGLGLRASGSRVCLTCHAETTFARTEHHGHPPASPGADCVACHMPETIYMQVDARHDHGIRIPRPALAASVGAPDPCTRCHTDRDAGWAAEALGASITRGVHWSERFAAGSAPTAEGQAALLAVVRDASSPVLVRASALHRVDLGSSASARSTAVALLASPEPLLRLAATEALATVAPPVRLELALRMLEDRVRSVRFAALEALVSLGRPPIPSARRSAFDAVVSEYVQAQRIHAERAESQVNLGNLFVALGRTDEGAESYAAAIRVSPHFVPAYVNLADVHRARGEDAEAERVLRAGIAQLPGEPVLHYALGLTLVRMDRIAEALEPLRVAATSPNAPAEYREAYALARDAAREGAHGPPR